MMKKQISSAIRAVFAVCSLCMTFIISDAAAAETEEKPEQEVQILFTHDMHSHLEPYPVQEDGKEAVMGGFAKLKTLADEKRTDYPATFLVDGGDFSMGTLYQTIYESEAPELMLMGEIGYDAVTFGNHEFDYRSEGVSNMLLAAVEHAKEEEISLPALVSANIDWDKNTSSDNQLVKNAMDTYGSTPYTVIERGGVRIGIYGVLGEDADACVPESGLVFEDIVETSKEMVEALEKENVDMILCLSHSGTNENEKKSEDALLAKAVPKIDVIISGHTHTELDEPLRYGDTYVVSSGYYCKGLGELRLARKDDGRWELEEYTVTPLDDTVKEDEEIKLRLAQYKQEVDKTYLKQFGYTFDQVLAENQVEFRPIEEFAIEHGEDPLGSVIADSYVYAVEQAEGDAYEKVYAAFSPSGSIRDTLRKGTVTVSDAFNISSLGIGADRIPGYPLVSVYLTGKELKTVAEIDVSISPIMTTAQLYPSGLRWEYNPNRLLLNKVTNTELVTNVPYTQGKETQQLEDDQMYRVVAGLYSAQMLGTIEDMSMGLLKIAPKDRDGRVIDDFEKYIIHDKDGNEVKEWYALASYLESFEKNEEGISVIPAYYANPEGRKLEIDSRNIIDIIKQPNKFAWIIYGVLTLVVLLLAGIVTFVVKKVRKAAKKNQINKTQK